MKFLYRISVYMRDPVDLRLRIMMYFMVGLVVYFVFDLSSTRAAGRFEELEKSVEEKIDDISVGTTLIDQVPTVLEKINELKNRKSELELREKSVLEQITRCNEKMLVDLFTLQNEKDSPFFQFRVNKSDRVGEFEHLIYTIELKGTFQNIVRVIEKYDESPCRWNIAEWRFELDPLDDSLISGTLVLDLFKPIEARP